MADRPCAASSGWSELPWDLLERILLQHLELPEALAVAAVCAPWRSAAAALGVPRSRAPWLVSQSRSFDPQPKTASKSTDSEFRSLQLGTCSETAYTVSLPQGRRHIAWRGASRGWLVGSDELSNLVLCNPSTFSVISLPPITDLGVVEAVYDDDGSIVGYDSYEFRRRPAHDIGCVLYQKVVVSSCDPAQGGGRGDYIAMAIYGIDEVSFARAGDSSWRVATSSTTPDQKGEADPYEDCVYHNGRFYTLTMGGTVEAWNLGEGPAHGPKKQVIVAGDGMRKITRYLVSTPWGDLLQIRALRFRDDHPRGIKVVEVHEINVQERKLVKLSDPDTAFKDHAVFVGLNESAGVFACCRVSGA